MLQRRQTIYLLLIAVITASLSFLIDPIIGYGQSESNLSDKEYHLVLYYEASYSSWMLHSGDETISGNHNTQLSMTLVIVLCLSILSILFFKKRKIQATIVSLNFLFIVASCYFVYSYATKDIIQDDIRFSSKIQSGASIPVILFLLNYLALRGIIADERLVKSMDRLR